MKTITEFIYRAFMALALACFTLSPRAQAQLSPPPDGGYPNHNTAEGTDALFSLTVGGDNTAIGTNALYSNWGGNRNTATGSLALYSNTYGYENTAIGNLALVTNTTGGENTAVGASALQNNAADNSTAVGAYALYSNTTGQDNTAIGFAALNSNTTAIQNIAIGNYALFSNTTGNFNTATGVAALVSNTTGENNNAYGTQALYSNATGSHNMAYGVNTLYSNTTGFSNIGIGSYALFNNTTGNENVTLGLGAGENLTTGNNNIIIGSQVFGVAGESKTIRIGKVGTQTAAYIAGIMGKTSARGVPVFINTNGQLGTATSSARFKDAIKPMDKLSEAILALKPVTFRYKKELDPEGVPQFGLVAEDVEKVNPDLVVRDAEGKVYTVRYEAVNAMLLNEFLKEHRTVQEQQKEIDALRAELKGQRALIQKVSDKVELDKPAPQTVLNNQ